MLRLHKSYAHDLKDSQKRGQQKAQEAKRVTLLPKSFACCFKRTPCKIVVLAVVVYNTIGIYVQKRIRL